jgi:hypothetical protein
MNGMRQNKFTHKDRQILLKNYFFILDIVLEGFEIR